MTWYYAQHGKQNGPVEESELKRLIGTGALGPNDLVWNETMGAEWAKVSTVFPMASQDPSAPPPIPGNGEGPVGDVSCVAPVDRAWARMKTALFSPFNMSHWFALGVSAWLATLGQMDNGSFFPTGNFNPNSFSPPVEAPEEPAAVPDESVEVDDTGDDGEESVPLPDEFGAGVERLRVFLAQNGPVVAVAASVTVLICIGIGILVLWLRARGKFMFLDNLVTHRADVSRPWHEFARHGNSLFRWMFAFNVIVLAGVLLILLVVGLGVVMPCLRARAMVPGVIPVVILAILVWTVFAIVTGYVVRFLEDFVVPIMYRYDVTATEAWRRFNTLLKPNFWKLVLYGLFYLVLNAAGGMILGLAVLVTCCLYGCLAAIPYVGAVAVLPITVYFRFYSLEYLAQFGPDFRVLPEDPVPPAG